MALSVNLDKKNKIERSETRERKLTALRALEKQSAKNRSKPSEDNGLKVRLDSGTKKKNSTRRYLKLLLLLILILPLGYFGYKGYTTVAAALRAAKNVGLTIKPSSVVGVKKDPELKRDKSGKRTNVLLVGMDTRGYSGGLKNTDSIIVASYDHETTDTVMISLPRDFYTALPGDPYYYKVNSMYWRYESKHPGKGMEGLKAVVENVTGLEIQYYGMVNLEGFKDVIDAIGGINVNVERAFVDYQYPADNDRGYITVKFDKGLQKMDGATALKYARSRHSSTPGEGDDYARARRQQNVIEATKAKVLTNETLLSPEKLIKILDTVGKNTKVSQFTVEDIQAGLALASKQRGGNYTIVLDPASGGGSLIKTDVIPGSYSIGPVTKLGDYSGIQKYIKAAMKNPKLYEKNPKIYVYDTGLGFAATKAKADALKAKYPYVRITYAGTLFSDKTGEVVYDNSLSKGMGTVVDALKPLLQNPSSKKPSYVTTRLNGEDITILYGKAVPVVVDGESSNNQ